MKNLLACFLLFSSIALNAQQHFKGIEIGGTFSEVVRPNYDYYMPVLGFTGTAFYLFQKNHFYSKSSLGVEQKGFSQALIFVDTNNAVLGEGAIEKTHFNYASLSEIVGFQFGNKFFGFGGIGFSASYYLFTSVKSDDFTLNNGQVSQGYSLNFRNLKPFDFALKSEVGFGVLLKNSSSISLLINYSLGIVKNGYENVPTPNPWRNNVLTMSIGLRYPIQQGKDEVEAEAED
jgi:hypothetical protein